MKNEKKPEATQHVYYKDSLWWVGMFLVVFGSLGDFAALSFTGQAIVAQIGATTLVANIFFAHCWLGESVSKWDCIGCALIVIGPGLSVGFGNHEETEYSIDDLRGFFLRPLFLVYASLLFVSGVSVYYFIKKVEPIRERLDQSRKSWDNRANLSEDGVATLWTEVRTNLSQYNKFARFHGLSYLALSGMFGANSILFGKSVSELLKVSFGGNNQFTHVLTYVFLGCMLGCIFSQLHFMAKALKLFDAMYCVPVFQCFFISLSTIAGGCYFYEFSDFDSLQWGMFTLGLLITLLGVYVMSMRVKHTASVDSVRPGEKQSTLISKQMSRMELELEELELELELEKSTLSRFPDKYAERASFSRSNKWLTLNDDLEDSRSDRSPLTRQHSRHLVTGPSDHWDVNINIDANPSPGQTPIHSPKDATTDSFEGEMDPSPFSKTKQSKKVTKKDSKKKSKKKNPKTRSGPVRSMLKLSHSKQQNKHHHLPSDEDEGSSTETEIDGARLRVDAPSAMNNSPFSSPESSDAKDDRGSATNLLGARKQNYRQEKNIGDNIGFDVESPVNEFGDGDDFVLVHRKPSEQKVAQATPPTKRERERERARRLVPIPKKKADKTRETMM